MTPRRCSSESIRNVLHRGAGARGPRERRCSPSSCRGRIAQPLARGRGRGPSRRGRRPCGARPRPAPDELASLADSFNQMAAALEQSERQRRDLIANTAHELRTPLTNLEGYLEGIRDGVIPRRPPDVRLAARGGGAARPARSLARRPRRRRPAGHDRAAPVDIDLAEHLAAAAELARPAFDARRPDARAPLAGPATGARRPRPARPGAREPAPERRPLRARRAGPSCSPRSRDPAWSW